MLVEWTVEGIMQPDNNAMNLTKSTQTDWGLRRLLQCWTGAAWDHQLGGHR